jgi:selenocysteine lyase/cysteine desulfurase
MNIEKYRDETPGINHVIHFNNAGASLISKPVFETIQEYLDEELIYGGYETADKYRKALDNFYPQVARLIHADAEEIAFMESATHAWDMAFFSIPFKKGDIILTSRIEYASNYIAYLQIEQRTGARVQPVDSTEHGEIDIEVLEKRVKEGNVKLISITHMPTNGGIVNPAEEVGKIAKEYGILYLLDACQSAGQYPLDIEKLQCDFLSATGRKYMRGPRGTGFLYARKDSTKEIEPLSLDLHSAEWTGPNEFKMREDARRFEKWECNPANKLGLAKAAEYCQNVDINIIWDRVQMLSDLLRNRLREIPGIEVLDLGRIQSGIVTFRSDQLKAEKIKYLLARENINTSMAIASGTLLDMRDRNIETAIRASVHYYNSEQEVDRFIQVLSKLVGSD